MYCELLEEGFQVSADRSDDFDVVTVMRLTPDLIVLDGLHTGRAVGWSILHAPKRDRQTATFPAVLCITSVHEVTMHTDHLAAMEVRVVLKPFAIDDGDINDVVLRRVQHDLDLEEARFVP